MSSPFKQIYDQSINKTEEFWQHVSEDIFWFKKPTQILNKDKPPFYTWFCDGVTNTCYNALDIHIDQGRGERIALIYDSPITRLYPGSLKYLAHHHQLTSYTHSCC